MLERRARNLSALRWYSWQASFPSCTSNWNRAWQGASAMSGTSAGFQAVTMWRRESGLVRICSTTWVIWSITPPSRVGQLRHCAP